MKKITERVFIWGGAVAAGLGAYKYFSSVPAMKVLRGFEELPEKVSPLYQASVFPAFAAEVLGAVMDLTKKQHATFVGRVFVVLSTGALSVVRLKKLLPLSGHVLFLVSSIVFEVGLPAPRRTPAVLPLATGALLLVAYYKVVHWDDLTWSLVSTAVAIPIGVIGALIARLDRKEPSDVVTLGSVVFVGAWLMPLPLRPAFVFLYAGASNSKQKR